MEEQTRLTKERQIADKRSATQSQIANKRWAGAKENNDLADAGAIPSQSQSQSQSHKERERVVRLKQASGMAGNCFVEVGSDEWEAWSKVRHWPQNDFDVDGNGRHKRGWYFPTPWPSSEFKP